MCRRSERYVRIAADSTMLRMVNRLMALSLGVHREQLEHRMGLTWPRPGAEEVSNCLVRGAQMRTNYPSCCGRYSFSS